MSGIVGYVGSKQVVPLILEGLKRLECRGYERRRGRTLDAALQQNALQHSGSEGALGPDDRHRPEGDSDIARDVELVIYVPQTTDLLSPIIEVIPMQLLAYSMAVHRGCDVDQPRNLAKSVTVE